jgi:hypothetical protein
MGTIVKVFNAEHDLERGTGLRAPLSAPARVVDTLEEALQNNDASGVLRTEVPTRAWISSVLAAVDI